MLRKIKFDKKLFDISGLAASFLQCLAAFRCCTEKRDTSKLASVVNFMESVVQITEGSVITTIAGAKCWYMFILVSLHGTSDI